MANIRIDDLQKAINKQLEAYADEVNASLQKQAKKTASEGVKMLKENSPKDTGDYANDWGYVTNKSFVGPDSYTIRNKKHYRLTHLLENGYAKVNGGRVHGRPHISIAEDEIIKTFTERIEKVIKGGGS